MRQREHRVHVVLDQQDRVVGGEALQQRDDVRRPPRAPSRRAARRATAPTGCVASAIAMSSARRSPCDSAAAATSARAASPVSGERVARRGVPSPDSAPRRESSEGNPDACDCAASRQFSKAENAREDVRVLERSRQRRAARCGSRASRVIVTRRRLDRPGRRHELARQQVDQRRLACAVRADHRVHGARAQRQRRPDRRRRARRSAG